MSKKNKIIRAKLIANPGAGDIATAASKIDEVTRYLLEFGFAAEGLILGKGTDWIKVLPKALQVIPPEPGLGMEKTQAEVAEELPEPLSPVAP